MGNNKNGPVPREVTVSKKLSWLLRHNAEKEGLTLDANGYINLADVLANRNLKSLKITYEEILQAVKDNDKQRFSLIPDPSRFPDADSATGNTITSNNPKDWLIRANQGHSIKIESHEGLLTAITTENMPTTAVHGTTHASWLLIAASGGLKPMGRNHVHFASGLPAGFKSINDAGDGDAEQQPVISGMRAKSSILMFMDVPKALEAGLKLGRSENGVILTEGDSNGLVPLELFKLVEDREGEGILLENGKIIKEAPASWATKGRQRRHAQ